VFALCEHISFVYNVFGTQTDGFGAE